MGISSARIILNKPIQRINDMQYIMPANACLDIFLVHIICALQSSDLCGCIRRGGCPGLKCSCGFIMHKILRSKHFTEVVSRSCKASYSWLPEKKVKHILALTSVFYSHLMSSSNRAISLNWEVTTNSKQPFQGLSFLQTFPNTEYTVNIPNSQTRDGPNVLLSLQPLSLGLLHMTVHQKPSFPQQNVAQHTQRPPLTHSQTSAC